MPQVIDEQRFEQFFKDYADQVNLGSVKTIYRNLRENYEYRLRYDEAGKFFIREMELTRNYRADQDRIKKGDWVRRNFSLIGLYYHLDKYGEDLRRPAFFGLTIIAASIFIDTTT